MSIDATTFDSVSQQFTGTRAYYFQESAPSLYITEGVAWACDLIGCGWLIDTIAHNQPLLSMERFQIWQLQRLDAGGALLVCEDGDKHVLYAEQLPQFQLDIPELTIWCRYSGRQAIALLPSED
jgi:hypothetical protein